MASELPCDIDGGCMQCKGEPGEEEKVVCMTCNSPWHLPCLSFPPSTPQAVTHWSCPDCSNVDPQPSTQPAPLSNDLVNAVLKVQNDATLTETQKAKKRQQLMTGKAPPEDEEEEEENQSMLRLSIKCPICKNPPEKPVTVCVPLLLPSRLSLIYLFITSFAVFFFSFLLLVRQILSLTSPHHGLQLIFELPLSIN